MLLMLSKVLFHGSDHIIEVPTPGGGKKHNDYGPGFYCTEKLELAREWACTDKSTAFVNHYSFEPGTSMNILNLEQPPYHVLNWLAILLQNREFDPKHPLAREGKEYILQEFLPPTQEYDIIYGYRADDSYFGIASSFLSGGLSLQQLQYALRLGLLGEQVFLQSKKAFDALVFLTAEPVDRNQYWPRRSKRDSQARETFQKIVPTREGIFLLDILRNEWRNDDARLR